MNAKISFLHSLLSEFKTRNTLFFDFDSQFSSYYQANLLKENPFINSQNKIVLPKQNDNKRLIEEALNFDDCNSLTVIDSLNGMIDYFNIQDYEKRKKTIQENKFSYSKTGGYKSLNFLFFLSQKSLYKHNPIVVTYYQSFPKFEKLLYELASSGMQEQDHNHFRRVSQTIFLSDYFDKPPGTFITILKKNNYIDSSCTTTIRKEGQAFFPQTIKLDEK